MYNKRKSRLFKIKIYLLQLFNQLDNFNTSAESGSHWVAYHKTGCQRIYFDSYGQVTLYEIQKYLKNENEANEQVIQRNTDIVQAPGTNICGHLCLYILKSLST